MAKLLGWLAVCEIYFTALAPTLIFAAADLKTYGACPAIWIVSRLDNDNACLPPTTDCMCYAPAWYLQGAAIDIASKCEGENDLTDTAATLQSNCAVLKQVPAINSAQFVAMGMYPASDTILTSPTAAATFNPATVPNAKSTSGISTVESVQVTFSGVTTIPGPGPLPSSTTSVNLGPAPVSTTTSTSSTPTASPTNAASAVRVGNSALGIMEMLLGVWGLVLLGISLF